MFNIIVIRICVFIIIYVVNTRQFESTDELLLSSEKPKTLKNTFLALFWYLKLATQRKNLELTLGRKSQMYEEVKLKLISTFEKNEKN